MATRRKMTVRQNINPMGTKKVNATGLERFSQHLEKMNKIILRTFFWNPESRRLTLLSWLEWDLCTRLGPPPRCRWGAGGIPMRRGVRSSLRWDRQFRPRDVGRCRCSPGGGTWRRPGRRSRGTPRTERTKSDPGKEKDNGIISYFYSLNFYQGTSRTYIWLTTISIPVKPAD